jgi:dimethylsulfone monooxygenase
MVNGSSKPLNGSEKLSFAYWVPNVPGGLVISKIEQRTEWNLDYNIKLAKIVEASGFDYAVSDPVHRQLRCGISTALLANTQRLKVIPAILPGPWHPHVIAKLGATADQIFGGR